MEMRAVKGEWTTKCRFVNRMYEPNIAVTNVHFRVYSLTSTNSPIWLCISFNELDFSIVSYLISYTLSNGGWSQNFCKIGILKCLQH